ncbi:hypothetical protein PCH_Pc20g07450 [Penicillium rubens Wisconsin 54-1255]|uniref:Uncharacterized protein n=1 Tax=Penicillium rubens (strain ATCC 28089 / DSM 1075 / NRRL 1951 / Wisconsin 54-1255) TaxID=500485 RepID=B6HDF1_PENRW|nr:hypothetical protein PCH_Pc20g07450 [Penicillium rubens Wisconsin 54-1255]
MYGSTKWSSSYCLHLPVSVYLCLSVGSRRPGDIVPPPSAGRSLSAELFFVPNMGFTVRSTGRFQSITRLSMPMACYTVERSKSATGRSHSLSLGIIPDTFQMGLSEFDESISCVSGPSGLCISNSQLFDSGPVACLTRALMGNAV